MKSLLKQLLAELGYRVQATHQVPRQLLDVKNLRVLELDDVICRRMFEVGSDLRFVQVGVFDGVTGDPLHRYIARCGWRGVLVEPQARSAARLRELYRDNERVAVLQAAVAESAGRRTLFTVESSRAPAWAGGLASFDLQHILNHAHMIPGLAGMICEEQVECVPFDTVLARLPPGRLDLLQIDVEGADAAVLALFPFDRVQPAIVHWEIKHLTKLQREGCLDRLSALGYRFAVSEDENMLATLQSA
jgi:FkbM family methyltransferase